MKSRKLIVCVVLFLMTTMSSNSIFSYYDKDDSLILANFDNNQIVAENIKATSIEISNPTIIEMERYVSVNIDEASS